MGRNIVYSQISFDVTRKCNLNCDFCTKGEPQNMTITKAIVDKTFKELKDSHVLILRLFGGEPFLSEDMIVYILEQAIKKLSFYNLAIDTNGTIYSSKVADAIKRVCIHLSDNVKYPPLAESTSIKVGNQQLVSVSEKICVLHISTYNHTAVPGELIDAVAKMYHEINMPNLYIKRDAGTGIESGINLCGQALKNYKTLLPNPVPLNKVGMWRNNEFDFIKDNFDEAILVDKTISISTNGDVYAGCSAPWNLISEIKLFNINDCNGDFYTQIENFCWAHPVNDGIHNVRKKYLVYNWLIDHGYQIEDCPADYAECLNYLVSTADAHEKIALHLHSLYPFINHYDIDTITTCRILQSFFENDIPPAVIQGYIDCCTKFTQEAAEELSTEQLKYYAEKTFLKYLRI